MPAPIRNISAPGYADDLPIETDTRALAVAAGLFFVVGFLTCLNDIVIPHLRDVFGLDQTQAMLVPFAFFIPYLIFSYPGGALVARYGYKKTMVLGLTVMAVGAAAFIPAANLALLSVFLVALIILAAGMTVVQVAVNPYVSVIGPAATASSRLSFAQAFNSLGTFLAPFFGSLLIYGSATHLTPERMSSLGVVRMEAYSELRAHNVILPALGVALVLLLLAIALAGIKLRPSASVAERTQDFRPGAFAEAFSRPNSIARHPWLVAAAVGIFTYVGAEVAIGSLLVNYMGLPQIAGLREATAAKYLMVYWGGAMAGRFIGSAVLQRVKTGKLLGFSAVVACLLVILSILTHGGLAMFALLLVGLFNSIMFPSIFALGIQDLGPLTSKGSSLMIAAVVGGAIIPLATGKLADHIGLHLAIVIPAICYVYIACFGIAAIRRPEGSDSLLPLDES